MKIEDFGNLTSVVDLWPMLTFWPFDLKNNGLLPDDKLYHVVKFREDRFKIVTCRRQTDKQTETEYLSRPPIFDKNLRFSQVMISSWTGWCRGSTLTFELSLLGLMPDPTTNCHIGALQAMPCIRNLSLEWRLSQVSHLLARVGGR